MILIVITIGWICGLVAATAGPTVIPFIAPLPVLALLAFRFRGTSHFLWFLLALAAAGLALFRFQWYWRDLQHVGVAAFTERSVVRFRGVVAADPLSYGSGVEFPLAVRSLENGGAWLPSNGTVMLRVPDALPLRAGDRLEAASVLLPPDPTLPPYASPLRQQGIAAVGTHPVLQAIGGWEPSPGAILARIRDRAAVALNRALPEPEAGLARGIALGQPRTLGSDLSADFARTNTSHILAVDGYKVGLVSSLFENVLRIGARPVLSALGTIGAIALYTAFVGGSPSALRAAIMGGLFALGRAVGRPRDTFNALMVAALVMTAVNPFLLWNLAFQLSFITTLGLTGLAPLAESWIPRGPRWLRESIGTTIAAEIASAPLIIATFDHVSLASIPVHAVVMPVLPLAIGLSVLTAMLGSLIPAVGNIVGLIAWFPLAVIVGVIHEAGSLSFAALAVPPVGLPAVVAIYSALALALLSRPNAWFGPGIPLGTAWQALTTRVSARWLVPSLGLPIVVVVLIVVFQPRRADRIDFLDVGNGDAALIELADGNRLYVQGDAGALQVARVIDPRLPFWNRSIPLALVSVGEDQAMSDLEDLTDRVEFQQAVVPIEGVSSMGNLRWRAVASRHRIETIPARPGLRMIVGRKAWIQVYPLIAIPRHGRTAALPPTLAVRLTLNSNSAKTETDVADMLWVSGQPRDQARLASAGVPLAARVLKLVGRSSSWGLDPQFLREVDPSIVILPSGVASQFAHATAGTLDLLDNRHVYRTDQDGTISITFGSRGVAVQTSHR